jgi:hypothetical protein
VAYDVDRRLVEPLEQLADVLRHQGDRVLARPPALPVPAQVDGEHGAGGRQGSRDRVPRPRRQPGAGQQHDRRRARQRPAPLDDGQHQAPEVDRSTLGHVRRGR